VILAVDSLHKRYGARVVLAGASLAVAPGELVTLLGDNGTGKSTLLAIVAGVLAPDAGTITLAGQALTPARRTALRQLGYAPESLAAPGELALDELVHLVAALRQAPLPDHALVDRLGLTDCFAVPLAALSLGQRRRALLLCALLGPPPLLVLDEPDAGLDADGVTVLVGLLGEHAAHGGGALIVSHDPELPDRLGARRLRLKGGRVT
jgi:ABC-2 type transport system ATP-binding protein